MTLRKEIVRNGVTEEVEYTRMRATISATHEDIIGDAFWLRNRHLLEES